MKKIAVNTMGGDNAPKAIIEGINRTLAEFSDVEVQLYGDKSKIREYLTAIERVLIIHTGEKTNSDDGPTKAIRREERTGMVLRAQAAKGGTADAAVLAGNTGALPAAGLFVVGRIRDIDHPGLMFTLPALDGKGYDMLDPGANAENVPKHLHRCAILRSFYVKSVYGIAKPRVGLLDNGTEVTRGDPLHKEAYALLAEDASLNFVGNVGAHGLMNSVVDAVISDGFTGNAVSKTIKGTAFNVMGGSKSSIKSGGLEAKLGASLSKGSLYQLRGTMGYSSAGGAILFGLRASVAKCHGSGDVQAVYYTIRQVRTILETNVVDQLVKTFTPKD